MYSPSCSIKKQYNCSTSGTIPLQKKLKETSVPHIFNWTQPNSPCVSARRQRAVKRRVQERDSQDAWQDVASFEEVVNDANEHNAGTKY